jgi:dihydrodipicolinate synthase/N-acetylneuraminate lyase
MHSDLKKSVVAVPPLARNTDFTLNRAANAALIRHMEQGGVSTLMYGGNANFYNISAGDYAATLDMLLELASPESWIIPSVGPDFGKMMDQVDALRARPFPTAMVLPASVASTVAGVESGIARFAERLGKPVIAYVRSESYLSPAAITRLVDKGLVTAVKYAIVRDDPSEDGFLAELIERMDKSRIISGIGERPAIIHWREFGLHAFTSGSVSIAPRASTAVLEALKAGDHDKAERLRAAFLPFETLRDTINPIRVLHDGVTLAGIADMGPILPLLSNLEPEARERVAPVARALNAFSDALDTVAA